MVSKKYKFPINPFPSVNAKDFYKYNKKHFSEAFVHENFNEFGWDVYEPAQDVGVDRIIEKYICPNKDTKLDQNLRGNKCPQCNIESIKITRFIQIKTRELKKGILGYTLKSQDFPTDPRIVFLLFSDHTEDFIIFSINDYFDFIINKTGRKNDFLSPAFKVGNNKINSIKLNKNKWTFNTKTGNFSLDDYLNQNGLLKIQNPDIEKKFSNLTSEIIQHKINHFFSYNYSSFKKNMSISDFNKFNNTVNLAGKCSASDFKNLMMKNLSKINSLEPETQESIKGYFRDANNLFL